MKTTSEPNDINIHQCAQVGGLPVDCRNSLTDQPLIADNRIQKVRYWLPIYHLLAYPIFVLVMRVAALWSQKIRRGLKGRTDWRNHVGRIARATRGAFRVHIHAASVGEFEQAKPLIEALRADGIDYRISVSFFSPSGYEQQKDYPEIDGACYIPHDRQGEMNEFVNLISPDLLIIIRYDLWGELLHQARLRKIPVVLVCGVLRNNSARFLPLVRSFFAGLYSNVNLVHAVSEQDRGAFERLVPGIPVEVSGDTRYDRVAARSRGANMIELPPEIVAGRWILVAGSTWPDDETLLEQALRNRTDLLPVLVPHEPTPSHVAELRGRFPGALLWSELDSVPSGEPPTAVIIDRTGMLSGLYRIGDLAYVGGGFGEGVHSVLEPAVYGVPVFCGPRIERSRDASAMASGIALTVVRTSEEFAGEVAALLDTEKERRKRGAAAADFVQERTGATERILESLRRHRFLPSIE